jgi:hypothetical protein
MSKVSEKRSQSHTKREKEEIIDKPTKIPPDFSPGIQIDDYYSHEEEKNNEF